MNINPRLIRGRMLIGGDLVDSESGDLLESVNPANEESIGYVPAATAADVNRAVVAAEAAHPAWAALEPKQRAKLVRQLAQKLRENGDLATNLAAILAFTPLPLNGDDPPIMLIGPPGSGKSLTVARLAAQLVKAGQKPYIISTDGARAGAAAGSGAAAATCTGAGG